MNTELGIQQALGSMAHVGTTWILGCLLLLSFAGFAIILERTAYFVGSRDDATQLREELRTLLSQGHLDAARKRLSESPSAEARVALAALSARTREGALEHTLATQEIVRLEMERYLAFLGTVGSNAPFVGLLGTVVGIVGAFKKLDVSGGALTDGLMGDIGEALVATAVGLLVALPAVAAFNVFRRVVSARLARAEALRRTVLAELDFTGGR